MEQMQWFLMGVLFTLSVFALAWLSVIVKLQWYVWGGMITGVLLILFGIGWAGASFMEGISQSGAMALIIFCSSGIVMIILLWRYLIAPEFEKQSK
jgi:hypothetical protein